MEIGDSSISEIPGDKVLEGTHYLYLISFDRKVVKRMTHILVRFNNISIMVIVKQYIIVKLIIAISNLIMARREMLSRHCVKLCLD